MHQAGVATASIVIVLAIVVGGFVGAPLAVDKIDVQPDHPLYSLERIGEGIKGATYAGGQDWQISLADERAEEFALMVEKGKAKNYLNLLEEADSHLSKAITLSEDNWGLSEASKALARNIAILEDVKTKPSEEIEVKISKSQLRNFSKIQVIENITKGTLNIAELEGELRRLSVRGLEEVISERTEGG